MTDTTYESAADAAATVRTIQVNDAINFPMYGPSNVAGAAAADGYHTGAQPFIARLATLPDR